MEEAAIEASGRLLVTVLEVLGGGRSPVSAMPIRLESQWGRRGGPGVAGGTTDERGGATWEAIPEGPYWVILDGLTRRVADVRRGEETAIEIVLERVSEVCGVVLDADGEPIAGAEIVLADYSTVTSATTVGETDARGMFRFRAKFDERRYVGAVASGFETSPMQALLPRSDSETGEDFLEFRMVRGGRKIAGRVVDDRGAALSGARVELSLFASAKPVPAGEPRPRRPRVFPSARCTSDSEGRFEFDGVPRAAFEIVASLDGFGPGTVSPREAGSSEAELLVTLEPAARVRGWVVDDAGRPVRDARIGVGKWGHPASRWTGSDADGSYVLHGIAPGRQVLHCFKGGYEPRSRELLLGPSETCQPSESYREVSWVLSRPAGVIITGRIEPPVPHPGGRWVVRLENDQAGEATSTVNGGFRLAPWPPGKTRVSVYHDLGCKLLAVEQELLLDGAEPLVVRVPPERAESSRVVGRVVSTPGRAQERYYVSFFPLGSKLRLETTTRGGDGSFAKVLPRAGDWGVEVSTLGGVLVASARIGTLGEASIDLEDIVVSEPGSLDLSPVTPPGPGSVDQVAVLSEAGVVLMTSGVSTRRQLVIPPGRYRVLELSRHAVATSSEVSVASGESVRVDVGQAPAEGASLRVKLGEGSPRDGWVRLVDAGAEETLSMPLSVGAQSAREDWVVRCPPGSYRLEVLSNLDPPILRNVVVREAEETALDLRCEWE